MKMKPRILINLNLILKELKFTINKHLLREKNLVKKKTQVSIGKSKIVSYRVL